MMKAFFVLGFLVSAQLGASDPAELVQTRESFDASVKGLILPRAKRYASELEAIRDKASREARPNDAGAIDIELVKARVRIIELSSSAPLLTKQKKGNAPLH